MNRSEVTPIKIVLDANKKTKIDANKITDISKPKGFQEEYAELDWECDAMLHHAQHKQNYFLCESNHVSINEPKNTFEMENILDVGKMNTSLLIKLYALHFTFEVPNSSSLPMEFEYNYTTFRLLEEITKCRLTPEILSELSTFEDLEYVDGSLVVDVRYTELQSQEKLSNEAIGKKLFLKNDRNALLSDVNCFIDQHFPHLDRTRSSLTEDEQTSLRLNHAINRDICLDPDQKVVKAVNEIQYNPKVSRRRRKNRPVPRSLSATYENALPVSPKKRDHKVLEYICKEDSEEPPPVRRKLLGKTNQQTFEQNFPRRQSIEYNPVQFLQNFEFYVNNKPHNQVRLIKFRTKDDKKRWNVQCIPNETNGTFSVAITYPTGELTRVNVGGRHAADLYIRRLKDIFTRHGEVQCSFDQNVDYKDFHKFVQAQGLQRTPTSTVTDDLPRTPVYIQTPSPITPTQLFATPVQDTNKHELSQISSANPRTEHVDNVPAQQSYQKFSVTPRSTSIDVPISVPVPNVHKPQPVRIFTSSSSHVATQPTQFVRQSTSTIQYQQYHVSQRQAQAFGNVQGVSAKPISSISTMFS